MCRFPRSSCPRPAGSRRMRGRWLWVAAGRKAIGILGISEPIKESTPETIESVGITLVKGDLSGIVSDK